MISWRVISPDPSYSGVFCYSESEKSTIYKKNVSSVYYIFIPGNETMWHKCWCQAFNAALDLFSLNLFLGVSCIFHKIIRKFWKPLQDSRKVTARQSPEWKDVGNASLIPTYSIFKSLHGALRNHFKNRNFSSVFPEIGIQKYSWKNKFMNQNPLTNFENMHFLIDETPSNVSMNKFS